MEKRNPYYQWMHRLSLATEELKELIPDGESFVLVDDNQWGIEVLTGRRAIRFRAGRCLCRTAGR